jgi:type III secretory pathway lipoprotein EscJ
MDSAAKNKLILTLKELRGKLVMDSDIRKLFQDAFPDLDYEEHVDVVISEITEFAVENNLTEKLLSLKGVEIFFGNLLEQIEDDEAEELTDTEAVQNDYGKA